MTENIIHVRPQQRSSRRERDVIVIGSGIGGLTCAALLAKRGMNVLVLEQHALAGGYCTSWTRSRRHAGTTRRFTFDAGVHDISGLGRGGYVRRLLEHLDVDDRLDTVPIEHEYVLDGDRFRIPRGKAGVLESLAMRFPSEASGIAALLDEIEAMHAEMSSSTPDLEGPARLRELRRTRRWLGATYGSMVKTFARAPRLREILTALGFYVSHEPLDVPAVTMAAVLGGYWLEGGVAPAGGSRRLADALVHALRAAGGRLRLRSLVERIHVERGHVAGVTLASGERIDATTVVSNACLRKTWLELVDASSQLAAADAAPIEEARVVATGLRPSTSAFMVFLGLDVVPALAPISFLRAGRSVGIANPSIVDATLASAGCAAVTLTSLVPPDDAATWDRSAPDYLERRERTGDALIETASTLIPGLRDHIIVREDATPATFARYTRATGGAIYGMIARESVTTTTTLPGLFVCGASVMPGPGIEAVVRSGERAADCIKGAPRTY